MKLITYLEFKRCCSIYVSSDGTQAPWLDLDYYGFGAISFFIHFVKSENVTFDLLIEKIKGLKEEKKSEFIIRKSDYNQRLENSEHKEEMSILSLMLEKTNEGDYIMKSDDFVSDIASNEGIVDFLLLSGVHNYEGSEDFYPQSDYRIKLETQMNQKMIITKNTTAIVGWLKFPEILTYETNFVIQCFEYWIRFVQEYESGQIPYIIPNSKREQWFISKKQS
jgi:hypothetical protein